MKFKLPFIIIVLLALGNFSYAQVDPNELREQLNNSEGIEKIEVLNSLSEYYLQTAPKKAFWFATEATTIAKQEGHRKEEGNASMLQGKILLYKKEYNQALFQFHHAADLFEEVGRYDLYGKASSFMGETYAHLGDYSQAKFFISEAHKVAILNREKRSIGEALRRFGQLKHIQGAYDSAAIYFHGSMEYMSSLEDLEGEQAVYHWMGKNELALNNLQTALKMLNNAYSIQEQLNYKISSIATAGVLAEAHQALNNYIASIHFQHLALDLSEELQLIEHKKNTLKGLSTVYKSFNKYEEALDYLTKYNTLKDSLFNAEKERELAELKVKYEVEFKEKEIKDLKRQKELQDLKLIQNNYFLYISITAVGLVSLLLVIFYAANRSKNKTNLKLKAKNEEIKRQNSEIEAQSNEIEKANWAFRKKNEEIEQQKAQLQAQRDCIKLVNQELQEAHQTIESQNRKLQEYNKELSKQVDQRTHELSIAYENILKINKELDTFLYKSSHDLKGPIMTLLGLCNLVEMEIKDPLALNYLGKINDTAHKMLLLLNNLLEVNRIKNQSIHFEHIYVVELLETITVELFKKHAISSKEIIININIEPKLMINLDKEIFFEIFFHLLDNCFKYRNDHKMVSQVEIWVETLSGIIEFHIKDNGMGVEKKIQNKIFEMFYRGNERSDGSGIGLYLANIAAERLEGNVTLVHSSPEGSHFKATLKTTPIMVLKDFSTQNSELTSS